MSDKDVDNVGLGDAETEELEAAKLEEAEALAAKEAEAKTAADAEAEAAKKAEEEAAKKAEEEAAKKEAEDAKKPADDGAPKGDAAKPDKTDAPLETPDLGPRARNTFQANVPEDIDEQIVNAKTKRDELGKQFEEGELGIADYHKGMSEVGDTLMELQGVKAQGAQATRMTAELHQQTWEEQLDGFWADHPEYTDSESGEYRVAAFKAALEKVNTGENSARSFAWFIGEAHKRVSGVFGQPALKEDPKNPEVDPPKKGNAEEKSKQADSLPKTLGDVPAAGGETIGSDEFSSLDNLDGMELEMALSKMPAEKADKYLDTRNIHA